LELLLYCEKLEVGYGCAGVLAIKANERDEEGLEVEGDKD